MSISHQTKPLVALEQFVDSTNRWNGIFGKEPMTFPLSQTDANNLMNKIAGELSPENLHCDGEIYSKGNSLPILSYQSNFFVIVLD